MKISRLLLTTLLLFIIILFSINQAGAATSKFNMNFLYSGGAVPEGPNPWATATFIDSGSNNVTLTMSTANLVGSEFISVWLFNIDPVLDLDLLAFSSTGIPDSVPDSINTGHNAFKAGPDKFYDIEFDFPQPNNPNRFTSGETVVYEITYSGADTMDALSFNFQSTSDKPYRHYYSAAHIQSIGSEGKSGWISGAPTVVPEPISSTLFIVGGLALGFRKFSKKRKTL